MYKKYFKRIFDILLSIAVLIILFPVIVLLVILVKKKLGSPILFKQERPGMNEEIFTLYKFRTMTDEKDNDSNLLPDYKRLTKLGKFLRSTSLDELPELYNILKGDMSFIGPRPLLVEYLSLYNENQKRRHSVRPGLSGLAQANGRNSISWEEKFDLDVYYVDHVSFYLDIKLFLLTIRKVFVREGINFENGKESNKFKGTNKQNTN